MSSETTQNVMNYLLMALIGAVIAAGVLLGQQLLGTTDPINWRLVGGTFVSTLFGTMSTALGSMLLPRPGREEVARATSAVGAENAVVVLDQVSHLREQHGVPPSEVTVVPADPALRRRVAEIDPDDMYRPPINAGPLTAGEIAERMRHERQGPHG